MGLLCQNTFTCGKVDKRVTRIECEKAIDDVTLLRKGHSNLMRKSGERRVGRRDVMVARRWRALKFRLMEMPRPIMAGNQSAIREGERKLNDCSS